MALILRIIIFLLLAFFSSVVSAACYVSQDPTKSSLTDYFAQYRNAFDDCEITENTPNNYPGYEYRIFQAISCNGGLTNPSGLLICPQPTNEPCGAGEQLDLVYGGCQALPDCSTDLGNRVQQISSAGISGAPGKIDVGGCQYVAEMCGGFSSGETACTYVSNGGATQSGDGDGSTSTPIDDTAPANCVSAGSDQVCYQPTGVNEGMINGEHIKFDKIPDTGISFLPGGSAIVGPNGPKPTNSDGTPKTPTAEIQWTPNASSGGSAGGDPPGDPVQFDYHQNGGGIVSSSGADAAIAGATSTAAGLLADIKAGQCGGPGQSPCSVTTDDPAEEEPSTAVPIGDLYEKGDKTFSSVLDEFTTRMNNADIIAAGNAFFTVNVSGSCPVWVIPSTWIFPAIPIDMQCSSAMNNIWPLISAIMIATAGFVGFRWAFL